MDLGPLKWHGQPSSIEVADGAINQKKAGEAADHDQDLDCPMM